MNPDAMSNHAIAMFNNARRCAKLARFRRARSWIAGFSVGFTADYPTEIDLVCSVMLRVLTDFNAIYDQGMTSTQEEEVCVDSILRALDVSIEYLEGRASASLLLSRLTCTALETSRLEFLTHMEDRTLDDVLESIKRKEERK